MAFLLKSKFGYSAAMLQLVCPASVASTIFDDVAGIAESAHHDVIQAMLAFTERDSFCVPAGAAALVREFAAHNPLAPTAVLLTGARDQDGTGIFYSLRHKKGAPSMSRHVMLGSDIQRKQFHTISVAGSHHIPITDYKTPINPLVDDYCDADNITFTIASSVLRTTDTPVEFPITDSANARFVPWSSGEWSTYTAPGDDIFADMEAAKPIWSAGCCAVAASEY